MRGADTQELLRHAEPLIFLSHWISIVEQMRSSPIPSLNSEGFQPFGRIQTVILYFIKLFLVSKCWYHCVPSTGHHKSSTGIYCDSITTTLFRIGCFRRKVSIVIKFCCYMTEWWDMELYVCREKLWFHKDLHTDLIINKLTPKMKLLLFLISWALWDFMTTCDVKSPWNNLSCSPAYFRMRNKKARLKRFGGI